MIRARGLSLTYGSGDEAVQAIGDLDLEVGEGQWLSVIGRSGCGKSSLLHVLAGLEAGEGQVEIEGSQLGLLGRSAFMPQGDSLLEWLRVVDNVAVPWMIAGESRSEARSRATSSLDQVGLANTGSMWPAQLSGGMRQRVALVRTVAAAGLHSRPVILMDEPLGALDGITRSELQVWLARLVAARGATVVLVTHDVTEAVLMSDRVVVMSGSPGRITAELDIPLPHPRREETQDLEEFAGLVSGLRKMLAVTPGSKG